MNDDWPEFDEPPLKRVAAPRERRLGDWVTQNWVYIEFVALAIFFELMAWRILIPGTITVAAWLAWSLGRQSNSYEP